MINSIFKFAYLHRQLLIPPIWIRSLRQSFDVNAIRPSTSTIQEGKRFRPISKLTWVSFVWGLSKLLCLFTFRFDSTKSNRPRRVLKIVILIASGRIIQSHDCYKGKTRSKLDFLMCGANIFFQIPVLYVFSRDGFFFFFFNWRLPLSVFNSCAIFCCAPNKNSTWQRNYSVHKTYTRVSHRQLACKHCRFQSSMFLSSLLEKRCISA